PPSRRSSDLTRARPFRARAARVLRARPASVSAPRRAASGPHQGHRRGTAPECRRSRDRRGARPLRRGMGLEMSDDALTVLSTRLCPWLEPPLARLDAARRAGRLGSAWLIGGPRGIGKLNLALVLASRLLGVGDEALPPLGPADAAAAMRERRVPADHHPDLHLVFPEPDKRTIGIDQVRELSEALAMKGFRSAAKVAVIEPAEAM